MRFLLPLALLGALLVGCRTNETPEAQVDDFQIVAQAKSKLVSEIGPGNRDEYLGELDQWHGDPGRAGGFRQHEGQGGNRCQSGPKVVRVVNNLQVAAGTKPQPSAKASASGPPPARALVGNPQLSRKEI